MNRQAEADNAAIVAAISAALALAAKNSANAEGDLNLAHSNALARTVFDLGNAEQAPERERASQMLEAIFERARIIARKTAP